MITDPKTLYLSQLRNKNTGIAAFRAAAQQLSHLLAYEALTHLQSSPYNLETPFAKSCGYRMTYPITIVPILRSGLAMLPAFLEFLPDASVGVLGLKRNIPMAETIQYYANIPPLSADHRIIIIDPMIATGDTACTALKILTEQVPAAQILFVGMVCAPEGIAAIARSFPAVRVIVAGHDTALNDKKFIIPGLGDFGDRFFGTVE
jgi:uracil phosphoribosyltransferase